MPESDEKMKLLGNYFVQENQWTFVHPMTSPRSGVGLVAHKDCLYAIGGMW